MGFMKEEIDTQATKWSAQFREALVAKKMLTPAPLLKSLREFGMLKKKEKPELIQSVLDWYCIHAGEEFVPRAATAAQFRAKFAQIVAAMQRSEPEEFTISPADQEAANMLADMYQWPVEILNCLPAIVQRTYANCKEMRAILNSVYDGCPPRYCEFASYVLHRTVDFPGQWFKLLHQQVGWMEHYTGNPMTLAFKPQDKRFKQSFWNQWSEDWIGKPISFDDLYHRLFTKKDESK